MSDIEIRRTLREAATAFIDEWLAKMCEDIDAERGLPVVVDFALIVATEDAADPDSDTYYTIVTSNCSHYRKVGLLQCAQSVLNRSASDD